jgi:hypothetical protein
LANLFKTLEMRHPRETGENTRGYPGVNGLNPTLHTTWLNNHALTLKRNTAKYYFGEKSSFLHTFLKICFESRKIEVKLKNFSISVL